MHGIFEQKQTAEGIESICEWIAVGLGVKVTNDTRDILVDDIMEKRAGYIQSNGVLIQEFSFSHSRTKVFMSRVFNNHFYGSVLWDLFERESSMLYDKWSVSGWTGKHIAIWEQQAGNRDP